ncbi:MAG: AAA family ATPase [Chloroflexota bacterium]|nr:AAA family ATPase [Chloroflexota bacterium]MDE2920474.1 AAA family ATPase [Chloroflexota bacterium]
MTTAVNGSEATEQLARTYRDQAAAIVDEVGKLIVGQREIVRDTVVCLIAGGNVLIEGVPGLGKTELVRALGRAIDLRFSRIQFTPDLMPADITGTNVVVDGADGHRTFRFEPGPVFANLVLADEINRATPKTQAALLEAMQERQVSVAREVYVLDPPFFVMATQNPIEMEGTYPLPEAQVDRFMFKLVVDYPTAEDLSEILDRTTGAAQPEVTRVATGDDLLAMGAFTRRVAIAPHVGSYVVDLVKSTHPEDPTAHELTRQYVRYGCSPRAAQAMVLAAKVYAMLDGRYNVGFDDIRAAARPAMRHRLLLNFEAEADAVQAEQILDAILMSTRRAGD